jgi:peptidoglycan/LPS O-acetylase OafA/YrhL
VTLLDIERSGDFLRTVDQQKPIRHSVTSPILSTRLSAGLDVARGLAACYVILHHVANARGWSNSTGMVFRFGQEAVLVFFLLSGFVIFANERTRAMRPGGYYLRRLRRIYPALVAAMVISTLVSIDNRTFLASFQWQELLGTILSIQDISSLKPGVIVDPYLNNDPLWSLSYEVAFYIVFPVALRLWIRAPSWTNHMIGAACCTAYGFYLAAPNHWSLVATYFLVWWCGAMAADGYLRGCRDFRSMWRPLFWLLLLNMVAAAGVYVVGYRGLGLYPFLMLRHFAVALLILVALFGPFGTGVASQLCRVSKPAAVIASLSYGLYVLHFPLLVEWHRARDGWGLTTGVIILIATAWIVDRQLNKWLPRGPSY